MSVDHASPLSLTDSHLYEDFACDLEKEEVRNNYEAEYEQHTAASVIQNAWRHSRHGIEMLHKNNPIYAAMTHKIFQKTCAAIKPLLQRGIEIPARREFLSFYISQVLLARQEYFIPVCKGFNAQNFPIFTLVKQDEKSNYRFVQETGTYMTAEAEEHFKTRDKKSLRSKKELDALVRIIRSEINTIPWDSTAEGCSYRAQAVVNYLILCGIPAKDIQKQVVVMPILMRNTTLPVWRYHTAPIIRLTDGSTWVIDPALVRTRAISLEEWAAHQRSYYVQGGLNLLDCGHFGIEQREEVIGHFNPLVQGLAFTTDHNLALVNMDATKVQIDLSEVSEEYLMTMWKYLAAVRSSIEKGWL